jgi:hypothetical protein
MFQMIKLANAWRGIRAAVESGSHSAVLNAVIDAGAIVGLTPDDAALMPAVDAAKNGQYLLAGELVVELTMAVLLRWFTPARMASMPGADAIESGLTEMESPIPMGDATPPEPAKLTPGQVLLAIRVGIALVKWIRERRSK